MLSFSSSVRAVRLNPRSARFEAEGDQPWLAAKRPEAGGYPHYRRATNQVRIKVRGGPAASDPVAACRHSQDPTVKLQEADVRRTTKLGHLARGGFPRHRQAHLGAERSRPGGWNWER